jgi:lipoyl-dependent peroxiredoxin
MTKPIYTAQARVTGGREHGHGRTTDGELDVQLRIPKEFGGSGGGTNPEQLLGIGHAACFEASMGIAAQRIGVPAEQLDDAAIDSKVSLIPAGKGALKLGVELAVELPSIEDPARAAELVRTAHRICPYSNATRGNIDVALTVNGVALEREAEPAIVR